ncbi:MAG: hypothetical protein Q4G35_10190 [Propionibacteriaceae bacterium]|nr:hypothetical protein [Propionibacteriaceae bacterium]
MDSTTSAISRRTVAKGALWAAPAVAVAGTAPAFASSPTGGMSSGGLCRIEKSGRTVNTQQRLYYLNVGPRADTDEVWKAGQTWSYTIEVKVSSSGLIIPNISNIQTNTFGSFSSVTASSQVGDTRKFTFTWTSNSAATGNPICVGIGWTGVSLDPKADIRVTSTAPSGATMTVLDPGYQENGPYNCDPKINSGTVCCNVSGFAGLESFPCQPYLP